MRIKPGFILQEVAGNTVALPTEGELNMMITLNGTGKFLWQQLEQERSREELIQALLATYEVDTETAAECVDRFAAQLKEHDFLV
jgi:hypothetical protein